MGEGRDGLRGTWVSSKGAVETNSDKAVTGGEVEQERNSVTVAIKKWGT